MVLVLVLITYTKHQNSSSCYLKKEQNMGLNLHFSLVVGWKLKFKKLSHNWNKRIYSYVHSPVKIYQIYCANKITCTNYHETIQIIRVDLVVLSVIISQNTTNSFCKHLHSTPSRSNKQLIPPITKLSSLFSIKFVPYYKLYCFLNVIKDLRWYLDFRKFIYAI